LHLGIFEQPEKLSLFPQINLLNLEGVPSEALGADQESEEILE
jgi:hypothetical protein